MSAGVLDVAPQQVDDAGDAQNFIVPIAQLDGGWSTRTFPHLLPPNKLAVADNVVYFQDGLISKRPGNVLIGHVGTGQPVQAMYRFYSGNPVTGKLIVHSSTGLYAYAGGAWTQIVNTLTGTQSAFFAQMYDPDNGAGATTLFVTDGVHAPGMWDGTTWRSVSTAPGFLPTNSRTGQPITPRFCKVWDQHLVYAGDPNDPAGIWISDALRPERFTGYNILDSAGTSYIAYYPGGQDSELGPVTGLAVLGPYLIVFRYSGIVVVVNTGTYGAFQYEFATISAKVGCKAPNSIKEFENYIAFFGGDRFYTTDARTVSWYPDDVPSLYENNAQSVTPPEIKNWATVAAVKRGRQFWAAYDATGSGQNSRIAVYDTGANGGYYYVPEPIGQQQGGAWARWPTGMPLNCGIECLGPGDNGQLFWGSAIDDSVYQHDVGTYSDNGLAITMEVRTKSFFFNDALALKTIQAIYVMTALIELGTGYTDTVVPYAIFDALQNLGRPVPIPVTPQGTLWGSGIWGSFSWEATVLIQQQSVKSFLTGQNPQGLSVGVGMTESSVNPFSLIGFGAYFTKEPMPQP